MAYFAAIAAGSGVPLFTRTRGDLPPVRNRPKIDSLSRNPPFFRFSQLPYPKLASLNGAHFFSSSLAAELRSCTNGGVKTVWKTFHDKSVYCILYC